MAQILAANASFVEATLPSNANAPMELTLKTAAEKSVQPQVAWQTALKQAIRSGAQLCQAVGLPNPPASHASDEDFPVFVPWEYVHRMEQGNPHDPLLLQVLAGVQELEHHPSGQLDPVGDQSAERQPGLLHKYDRRVLMITTGACAIHCRYCFRRHYPYHTAPRGRHGWSQSLQTIADDHSLDEVILSGGDPLTLADSSLAWLTEQIGNIAHIRRLRVHTRLPVVIPQRVCDELLQWVDQSQLAMYFVLHFNHAREIDCSVQSALRQLRQAGATLLNQAVMLRGVNDSVEAQSALCLSLANEQVLPYYVHQLDPVQGAMHFAVPDADALAIIREVQQRLPGYAVPKLVREIAGQPSKTPLS